MVKEQVLQHYQDSFWNWSCQVYESLAVKASLLQLQDSYQLNVNYVLLALWSEQQGIVMDTVVWKKIMRDGNTACQTVSELRHKRRQAKAYGQSDKYQKLLALELKGEKLVQQLAIKSLLPFWPVVPEQVAPMANLRAYIETQAQSRLEAEEATATAVKLGGMVQKLSI